MDTVLISLEEGAGVVRKADGMTLVTGDIAQGWGTYLRREHPYQPESSWLDAGRAVVGGLLAPGVASVEVIDDRGTRTVASIGDGAYAAIIGQPNGGYEPVCWRDAGGALVRRLWQRARDREISATVVSADRSEQMLAIDGVREPFLTLTTAAGWVAVRRHSDLTVTVTGRDIDPATLTIKPIADPPAGPAAP